MTKYKFFLLVGVLICGLVLTLAATQNVAAASHIVNNTGDGGDATPGDGVCETGTGNGICTLRAAIEEANAATGPDTITFGSSIGMVIPTSALPALDDTSGGTTIQGNPTWIYGNSAGADVNGLSLTSDNNKIQGLWITGFSGSGLWLSSSDNNIIGVDGDGVDDANEGNIISGNGDYGIIIQTNSAGNRLAGNIIGLGNNGTVAAGNGAGGIDIRWDANSTLIGTNGDGISDALERNTISGNIGTGIGIHDGSNVIAGNYIGTNAAGDAAVPNTLYGIYIGSANNRVGTDGNGISDQLERNIISGNADDGIMILGADATQNVVAGNYIGTNAAGDVAIPNAASGVHLFSTASDNLIGTDGDGPHDDVEGNLISGNQGRGIEIGGSCNNNVIAGNYIGINAAGDAALPNDQEGILIEGGSANNRIGTDADGISDEFERNIISGNSQEGIHITSPDSNQNVIAGNYIGTNAAGNMAIQNGEDGVFIIYCFNNRVGGILAAERNIISGNRDEGVRLGYDANNNLVQGNYIGIGADGLSHLGNGGTGVFLGWGAFSNTVGGMASGAANWIAFNGLNGIDVEENASNTQLSYNNGLRGNIIFANDELGIDLSPEDGVTLNDPGDSDDGSNHLQNFPVLASAVSYEDQIIITGALNSTASTTFAVDFYANSSCDSSGYGEGEIYLGAATVTTDGSGDASFTTSLPISVTVGYSLTATATDPDGNTSEFSLCQGVATPEPRLLTVHLDGAGSGTVTSDLAGINCPGDCNELYAYDTQVTLSASANADSVFAGWSGVCTGMGDCTLPMTEPRVVTATFDLLPPGQYALTVNLAGDGSGRVTGTGIDCYEGPGADCVEIFSEGTVVTLTASTGKVSAFSGWSGAGCSGMGDCVVTMTANQAVTATFVTVGSEIKIFLPLTLR